MLVRDEVNNWHKQKVRLRVDGKRPKYVMVAGERYRFEPSEAFFIKGGDPFRYDGFWAPLLDWIDIRPKWLLFYRGPGESPVDMTTKVESKIDVNPRLLKVLTRSKLFDDYLRHIKYDKSVSTTTLVLILVGVIVLFIGMYFGGYW